MQMLGVSIRQKMNVVFYCTIHGICYTAKSALLFVTFAILTPSTNVCPWKGFTVTDKNSTGYTETVKPGQEKWDLVPEGTQKTMSAEHFTSPGLGRPYGFVFWVCVSRTYGTGSGRSGKGQDLFPVTFGPAVCAPYLNVSHATEDSNSILLTKQKTLATKGH